jgi:hypothetical protein
LFSHGIDPLYFPQSGKRIARISGSEPCPAIVRSGPSNPGGLAEFRKSDLISSDVLAQGGNGLAADGSADRAAPTLCERVLVVRAIMPASRRPIRHAAVAALRIVATSLQLVL